MNFFRSDFGSFEPEFENVENNNCRFSKVTTGDSLDNYSSPVAG
jgi:hypothetical protein